MVVPCYFDCIYCFLHNITYLRDLYYFFGLTIAVHLTRLFYSHPFAHPFHDCGQPIFSQNYWSLVQNLVTFCYQVVRSWFFGSLALLSCKDLTFFFFFHFAFMGIRSPVPLAPIAEEYAH